MCSGVQERSLILRKVKGRSQSSGRRPGRRPGAARNPTDAGDTDTTLTDLAYAQLEELIVTLQLPPGAVLSELVLSKRLNIGRTPIREALQRLSRDGLVNIMPRRGILVSEINVSVQLRLLEVRRELERLMARCAAERATDAERLQFGEISAGMRLAAEQADDLAFMRFDQQLNTLIAAAARNEFATRSMGLMHGLSRRFWYQHYRETADLPRAARLHAEVAEAIAARDPERAAAASDQLVGYIESFARATV